jgi:F420-non-reducing hydrogenase iron-sulfur subunit
MLRQMGIDDDRVRLEWISAAEADRFRIVMTDMVEKVRALGPLRLRPAEEVFTAEVVS